MTELSNIKTNKVRHDAAYNAAHDVGEALLAAFGYRTALGAGQHAAVGEFLGIIFAGLTAQELLDEAQVILK